MYYEILLDGASLGVYGHPRVRSMNVSVMLAGGVRELFASAVCVDDGDVWMYEWLQQPIAQDAAVEVRATERTDAREPRAKSRMSHGHR